MKKGIITLLLSSVIVASLLLASCGTTQTETTTATSTATTTKTTSTTATTTPTTDVTEPTTGTGLVTLNLTKLDGTTITKEVEEPQYGGTIGAVLSMDASGWDPTFIRGIGTTAGLSFIMEPLAYADWTRGPAGTEEMSLPISGINFPADDYMTGCLAESWEQVDQTTISIKLREGIYWQDKAPANGRELDADDIVACLNRSMTSATSDKQYVQYIDSVTADDKYNVTIKLNTPQVTALKGIMCGRAMYYYPREIIEQNVDLSQWQNVLGSGPFSLDDVVVGSTYTFLRNDNYWGTDPFFPDNQLPYLERVRLFLISDSSAQQSAIRTGKLDLLIDVAWQTAEPILQTNPEIQSYKAAGWRSDCFTVIVTHPDGTNLADGYTSDINVRKALCMAINRDEIVSGFQKGNGLAYNWPFMASDDPEIYVALEDLPADVAEQFEYNPEKAKQLLADAGYSNLTIEPFVQNRAPTPECAEVLSSYWSAIGIDVSLQLLDTATFNGKRDNKELYGIVCNSTGGASTRECVQKFLPGDHSNYGNIDTVIQDLYDDAATEWDPVLAKQKLQDAAIRVLSNVWAIAFPQQVHYTLWTPRTHNYEGLASLTQLNWGGVYKYVWLSE